MITVRAELLQHHATPCLLLVDTKEQLPHCWSSTEGWYTWVGEGREEPLFTSRQFLSMLVSAMPLVAMYEEEYKPWEGRPNRSSFLALGCNGKIKLRAAHNSAIGPVCNCKAAVEYISYILTNHILGFAVVILLCCANLKVVYVYRWYTDGSLRHLSTCCKTCPECLNYYINIMMRMRKTVWQADLQKVGLVGKRNGFSQGNIKGIGWDAAQESHGVGASKEGMILTRFSGYWVFILVLQSWTWGRDRPNI